VLDAPEQSHVFTESSSNGRRRTAMVTEMPLRRDAPYAEDYSEDEAAFEREFARPSKRGGLRLSLRGAAVPKTLWGRIAAGCGVLLLAGAGIAAALTVRNYILHDDHFVVPSSDAIQIAGNSRLTRAQLLSVFGEDVERNIFNINLAQRRAQLESLPWVEHATVMRLLPNRIRVSIVERVPVAYVRQGSEIDLVDANGVLLNLPGAEPSGTDLSSSDPQSAASVPTPSAAANYSFPVLTGISAEDPLSTRSARMKLYLDFLAALDAGGANVSHQLSEVDVSSPEDVKAIISEPSDAASGSATHNAGILIHFGDGKYLDRYRQYEQHLAEWRAQYPKLASVDMRYERQVVLEMQAGGSTAPSSDSAAAAGQAASNPAPAVATQPAAKPVPAPVPNATKAKGAAKEKIAATAKTKSASKEKMTRAEQIKAERTSVASARAKVATAAKIVSRTPPAGKAPVAAAHPAATGSAGLGTARGAGKPTVATAMQGVQ